ncbi:MAG: hypothetical protein ABR511_08080 [Acidimicrobiales bacterium]
MSPGRSRARRPLTAAVAGAALVVALAGGCGSSDNGGVITPGNGATTVPTTAPTSPGSGPTTTAY